MKIIKIVLEYDGSAYRGWQKQRNACSLQETIEKVLERIVGAYTPVVASGRTDAEVHAAAQVASFKIPCDFEIRRLQIGMNALLSEDIVVTALSQEKEGFHARFSSKGKVYRYTIRNKRYDSAFTFKYEWLIEYPLNIPNMRTASRFLLGKNDFSSFRSTTCGAMDAVREVTRIDIVQDEEKIFVWCEGDGFLKQMVRSIVGTLVDVGRGKLESHEMGEILQAKDRRQAGPTAPGRGLCLMEVLY